MFSLFNLSSIFPGGSADTICPYVQTPMPAVAVKQIICAFLCDLLFLNTISSNFVHQQVIKRRKTNQKPKHNKHQNTINVLDYQAVTHACVADRVNCK